MVSNTDIHPNLLHWLAAYPRGRQCRTIWQGVPLPWRNIKTGVPQGSVLGPILFNFFVSDCPVRQPSYADDFTFSRSGVSLAEVEAALQADIDAVVAWAESKMLNIAPEKCSITYFTPDKARESKTHPQVFIDGRSIPLDKSPRILGVHFDTHFAFHVHAQKVVKSCRDKLRALRALAGTSWGCQKETLLLAYKTYVEPIINYAAAIWVPNVSQSSLDAVQRVQNSALRLATGCHLATDISHLHREAQFAFVGDHLEMLCTQFLASCSRDSHPSNDIITQSSGHHSMKDTLQSKFSDALLQHAPDGVNDDNYKQILQDIHTSSVKRTISNLRPNLLLDAQPPNISPSEQRLTRLQRTTLAQLRSSHCSLLGDYKVLTGRSTSALCPECLLRRHTVRHLFDCDARPTSLTMRDLWVNPVLVVDFLVSLPSFSTLITQNPPLPPPPPEPPP